PKTLLGEINPKGALQEFSQEKWGKTPVYRVLHVEGPEHDPSYDVEVSLRQYVGCGHGRSRKLAEIDAAKKLLDFFHSPEFRDDGEV
ncbi:MAG: putative dsRNA-binding protein, partial [Victivallaceae bacterium]|nr:putative dsRNA-binding protein [Victivallaceae bacterium]